VPKVKELRVILKNWLHQGLRNKSDQGARTIGSQGFRPFCLPIGPDNSSLSQDLDSELQTI